MGVISAIGDSLEETLSSFQAHRSGIGPITHFDSRYSKVLPVGEVRHSNTELADTLFLPRTLPRTALLGIWAARAALAEAALDVSTWRTGLISATTVGGMDKTENFFVDFLKQSGAGRLRDVVYHECGSTTEIIAGYFGITDFLSTINTACSSSVNAIALGTRLINHGLLDIVVAGGSDALSKFTLNGFNSLMILDQQPCRPFDAHRSGLNLGEGAGFVVLASEQVMQATTRQPEIFVSGYANTNDAFHQTASSPEGRGSFGAMQKALAMSGLEPAQIDYINLHGTGTLNNDLSESTAVHRLYGDRYPKLSSTKAFTGHTLGASGGIESVFSVLSIRQQCVFPNLRFENPIPEIGLKPQLHFQSGLNIQHVMSNSFGFGGNCSSIVFSKV
jgi:3-oxoacyl-[acyl-carrier-protein] synthase-1